MRRPVHRVEPCAARRRHASFVSTCIVGCLFFFLISTNVSAQPGRSVEEVIPQLDDRFEVSRTPEGWKFEPQWDPDGWSLIEVRDRRFYVDDRVVLGTELVPLIGRDDAQRVFFIAQGGPANPTTVDGRASKERALIMAPPPRPAAGGVPSPDVIRAWTRFQIWRSLLRIPKGNDGRIAPSEAERLTKLRREIAEVCTTRDPDEPRELWGVVLCSTMKLESLRRSDILVVGGDLEVSGVLAGQAVVVGDAAISGLVQGDLLIVGGTLEIEGDGKISGDVYLVSGTVEPLPDGAVGGTLHRLEYHEVMAGAWP